MSKKTTQRRIDISNYRIVFSDTFKKSIDKIDKTKKDVIMDKLEALEKSEAKPKYIMAKLVHGSTFKKTYSMRNGMYRIGFTLNKGKLILTFIYVANRDHFYDKFEKN